MNSRLVLSRFVTGSWLLFAGTAFGIERHVDQSHPNCGTGTPANPYCGIKAGVNAAQVGDRVIVHGHAGAVTYTGSDNKDVFVSRSIEITCTEPPCIMDLQGSSSNPGRAFIVTGGSPAIRGLTIRNGYASTDGGCIRISTTAATGASTVSIENNVFEGCTAANEGGGIWVHGRTSHSVTFTGNTIGTLQPLRCGGGHAGSTCVDDTDCSGLPCLSTGRNYAENGGGILIFSGGGHSASITIRDTVIRYNYASTDGGGILFSDRTIMHNCIVEYNRADFGGGVSGSSNGQHDSIIDSTIVGNLAGSNGGGIFCATGPFRIIGTKVIGNKSKKYGAGVGAKGGTHFTITNCRIESNRIDDSGNGAGLYLSAVAPDGGVVLPSAILINSLVAKNTMIDGLESPGGAGIYVQGPIELYNCTVVDNGLDSPTGTPAGGMAAAGATNQDATIVNCIFDSNYGRSDGLASQIGLYGGSKLFATYSAIHGPRSNVYNIGSSPGWGTDMIYLREFNDEIPAPGFRDALSGNYRPVAGATVNDRGNNADIPSGITTDLDGSARRLDDPLTEATGAPANDAPYADMGAYESADCNANGVHDTTEILNGAADCNGNGIPDECDTRDCAGEDFCLDCDQNGVPDICCGSGDADFDCLVDLDDIDFFDDCKMGPSIQYALGTACIYLDMDCDHDVDLYDQSLLQNAFNSTPAACNGGEAIPCDDATYVEVTVSASWNDGIAASIFPNPLWSDEVSIDDSGRALLYSSAVDLVSISVDASTAFSHWLVDGVPGDTGETEAIFDPSEIESITAVYRCSSSIYRESDQAHMNRFLAFGLASDGLAADSAIRVELTDLMNPIPAAAGTVPDFSEFEGQVRWIGPPTDCVDPDLTGGYFKCASLQCEPHYRSWKDVGIVYVTGPEILPSSTYAITEILEDGEVECPSSTEVSTARWGDIAAPFQDPQASTPSQPNVIDVGVAINKLKGLGGVGVFQTGLVPHLDPHTIPSIMHVGAVVDATKGIPYGLHGPCECPSAALCSGEAATECSVPSDCGNSRCLLPPSGGSIKYCRDVCGRCKNP